MRYFYLGLFGLLTLPLCAQTGPGGVGTTDGLSQLEFWYSVDAETTYANGNSVTRLADLSGNANPMTHGSEQSGRSPSRLPPIYLTAAAGVNALPALEFDESEELGSNYVGNSNDEMTFFIVARPDASPDRTHHVALQHGGRNTLAYRDDRSRNFIGENDNIGGSYIANTWQIFSITADPTITEMKFYTDGKLDETLNYALETETRTSRTYLGNIGTGGGDPFSGQIAEVMKFQEVVSTTQHILIQNYLSAKYDIPSLDNDLYVRDDVPDKNYDIDVAGIGRVSATDLHTDSRGTGIVRMQNPANLDDDEFLLWGSNDLSTDFTVTTNLPSGVSSRMHRVWGINEVNTAGTAGNTIEVGRVDLTVYPDDPTVTEATIRLLVKQDGGDFSVVTPTGGTTASAHGGFTFKAVRAVDLEDGDDFTFGIQAAAAPITLLSFTAEPAPAGGALLRWETQNETDNEVFTVERATDRTLDWKPVGKVAGAGTTRTNRDYELRDPAPPLGITYYRLRQTDYDGTTTLSNVLTFRGTTAAPASPARAYPNPTTGTLHLDGAVAKTVRDVYGRRVPVGQISVDGTHSVIDLSHLAPGVYLIETERTHLRVVKR